MHFLFHSTTTRAVLNSAGEADDVINAMDAAVVTRGKQAIRAKYHSRTLTGRFVQDDSRNNRDDSHADVADLGSGA